MDWSWHMDVYSTYEWKHACHRLYHNYLRTTKLISRLDATKKDIENIHWGRSKGGDRWIPLPQKDLTYLTPRIVLLCLAEQPDFVPSLLLTNHNIARNLFVRWKSLVPLTSLDVCLCCCNDVGMAKRFLHNSYYRPSLHEILDPSFVLHCVW